MFSNFYPIGALKNSLWYYGGKKQSFVKHFEKKKCTASNSPKKVDLNSHLLKIIHLLGTIQRITHRE